MPILSEQDAAEALDYETVEELPAKVKNTLIPGIDDFLKNATGKDWGTLTDTYKSIDPMAKMIAGILLVRWVEDPGQIGQVKDDGLLSLISQLEAKYLQEKQAAT